jgi:hypothetical protein
MFTTKWRKQLYKVADLVFEIPCGAMKNGDGSQCELPWWWGLFFLLPNIGRGKSAIPQNFWQWQGNCARCGKRIQPLRGIFCAKFTSSCRKVWCGSCYRHYNQDSFWIYEPQDKDGFVWRKKGDKSDFKLVAMATTR